MKWRLFATFADAAGTRTVALDLDSGATLANALDGLLDAHPELAADVLDEGGRVHEHVNVLWNGEDPFSNGEGMETPIDDGDELALFPPMSGG